MEKNDIYMPYMKAFISPYVHEVDTPEDFQYLEYEASKGHLLLDELAKWT